MARRKRRRESHGTRTGHRNAVQSHHVRTTAAGAGADEIGEEQLIVSERRTCWGKSRAHARDAIVEQSAPADVDTGRTGIRRRTLAAVECGALT